jgi:hypothetical protein
MARVTRPVTLLETVLHLDAFLRQSRRRTDKVRSDAGERLGSERASTVAVRSVLLVLQEVFLGVLEELSDMRSFDHVARLCAEKALVVNERRKETKKRTDASARPLSFFDLTAIHAAIAHPCTPSPQRM